MKNIKTYKSKWYEFTPDWSGFAITYELAGYYDTRPVLQIYFIWGKLFLYMPWTHYKKVKRKPTEQEIRYNKLKKISNSNYKEKTYYKLETYEDSDNPRYGIYYHMSQICICYGKKSKFIDTPWSFDWIRTSVLTKEYKWIHETKKSKSMNFWDKNKWKDIILYKSYPYVYTNKYNHTQNCIATYYIVEREWRLKYFKWFKPIRKVIKDIEVEFSSDGKNLFNSNVVGCSYQILKGEHDKETLTRMEKEKKF
jgi:hypothetical protein